MTADALCDWLATGRDAQRDKLARLRAEHLPAIANLDDADHKRVVREIKKRLNSPRLAGDVATLLVELTREYAPEPPAPAAPAPIARDTDPAAPFEAAIAADPDNRDNYLVYGDWLEQQGHPLGALIAIGGELTKNPSHKDMLVAHRDHLRAHPTLLGPLADCEDLVTDVTWQLGFIRACRVASTLERFNRERPRLDIHTVLGWLLDEPGPGRFLQELTLGLIAHDENFYSRALTVLGAKPRPTLHTLFVGDFTRDESELNWADLGDCTALWPQLPNLRSLTLRGGTMKVGPISLPKLERLETITGGLDAVSLGHIAAADWPELRTLSLMIGRAHEGAARVPNPLLPLLTGARTPKLQRLGILNCEFTDELCEWLVTSPIVDRISELDLSMGTMSADGVAELCAHADRLRHLAIDVDDNYLTDAACEQLRLAFPNVRTGEQRSDRGDPQNRYASKYE